MRKDMGVQQADGLSQAEPTVSALRASIPDADRATWFCNRGEFWGTLNQYTLCAKCGKRETKRHDEPLHWGAVFTSKLHYLCDDCFASLPAQAIEARSGETTGSTEGESAVRQDAPTQSPPPIQSVDQNQGEGL